MGMYKVLMEMRIESFIICEHYIISKENYRHIDLKTNLSEVLNDSEQNLLIYHHSINWELGESVLKQFNGKKIVKYHNITPESFFEKYNSFYYQMCKSGREQTKAIASFGDIDLFIGDSSFNVEELKKVDVSEGKLTVIPPFHQIEEMKSVNADVEQMQNLIDSPNPNFLFVGRVVPNKGYANMIRTLKTYNSRYEPKAHLWLVGGEDTNLRSYSEHLKKLIDDFSLMEYCHFVGRVSQSKLKSFFLGCDVFLCLSEHEGFCVPIIEAQFYGLPVLAYKIAAVPETLQDAGLLLGSLSPEQGAELLLQITQDSQLAWNLRSLGYKNYITRFSNQKIKNDFISIVRDYL